MFSIGYIIKCTRQDEYRKRGQTARGLTLIECLVLLMIVSVVALGVGVGLQAMAGTPHVNDQEESIAAEITSELEIWRATPFATLATDAAGSGTTTSDTVSLSVGGTTKSFSRKVSILQWDPNNPATDASPQSDFVQVQVTIGDRTASLWMTQP